MDAILVSGRTTSEHWMDPLGEHFSLHRIGGDADPAPVLAEAGPAVRALVAGGGFRIGEAIMDSLPNLGIIVVTGAGFDQIDLAAANARGIGVCNAPGATNACVADMAMGLYLAVCREIVRNDRFVRSGEWLETRPRLTRRASGRTAGIWGFGGIGRAIAERATGFAMEVHYCARRPRADVPYRFHERLADLASEVDVLFCAVPATPETVGAVDAAVLERLGPEGILVNVARGKVADEPALVAALQAGTIAGAGLDVFAEEPQVPPELLALDNVVLTPHAAGSTHETWGDVIENARANIEVFLRDGRFLTPVPQ
jgi:lactate dehydrogenase-like 2-hydroxyacid dehydrogenase